MAPGAGSWRRAAHHGGSSFDESTNVSRISCRAAFPGWRASWFAWRWTWSSQEGRQQLWRQRVRHRPSRWLWRPVAIPWEPASSPALGARAGMSRGWAI